MFPEDTQKAAVRCLAANKREGLVVKICNFTNISQGITKVNLLDGYNYLIV